MEIRQTITTIGKRVKEASKLMATLPTTEKNDVIMEIGEEIIKNRDLLEMENKKDLKEASSKGLSSAMIDRLTLSNSVIDAMVEGLCDVAKLPDPVGEVTGMWRRPNGLLVGRMRIPLGVVGIIYESRPNVTIDASSLCLKSGNGVLLRGGSEALHSNIALTKMVQSVLERHGIPQDACQIIPTTNREAIYEMILMEDYIDVIIPRGGDSLIRFIVENSKIPVIKHYKGICHTFIDESADKEMAEKIVINAKVQRPGVCNSLETLLVHKNIAASFLPTMIQKLHAHGVEIRGCEKVQTVVPEVKSASEEDWDAEYLDLILAVKVVDGIYEAIEHIDKHGSSHTEAIITKDYHNSQKFLNEVNSSLVLVNASTRFNDGFQLGLGAEIGISTTKIHAFGPMSLEELTTRKFIAMGDGQIRE